MSSALGKSVGAQIPSHPLLAVIFQFLLRAFHLKVELTDCTILAFSERSKFLNPVNVVEEFQRRAEILQAAGIVVLRGLESTANKELTSDHLHEISLRSGRRYIGKVVNHQPQVFIQSRLILLMNTSMMLQSFVLNFCRQNFL